MTQNRPEDLVLMSCKADVIVDRDKAIDNFASRSTVMSPRLGTLCAKNYSSISIHMS